MSRYYDTVTHRFVNSDGYFQTGNNILDVNMNIYCRNNPVNCFDPTGTITSKQMQENLASANPTYSLEQAVRQAKLDRYVVLYNKHAENRRPYTGEPGSTYRCPNGDTRTYGEDRMPLQDYDHDDHGFPDKHPHDENGGHRHDWVDGVRGPAYSVSWDQLAGGALVVVCGIGIAIVAIDNFTGVGVADDFLFGPLGAGVSEGIILISG